jgi:hypothetical protein
MSKHAGRFLLGAATGAVVILLLANALPTSEAAQGNSVEARLQHLEDREQILDLLTAYGATLDRRDFAAFGNLFAEDAEYRGGTATPTRGRAAIQAQLQTVITTNPSNLPGPNSHLSFNPVIRIEGNRASARSLGAYVAPDPARQVTQMVFFVSYDDQFVRQNGRWLFQRRAIGNGTP